MSNTPTFDHYQPLHSLPPDREALFETAWTVLHGPDDIHHPQTVEAAARSMSMLLMQFRGALMNNYEPGQARMEGTPCSHNKQALIGVVRRDILPGALVADEDVTGIVRDVTLTAVRPDQVDSSLTAKIASRRAVASMYMQLSGVVEVGVGSPSPYSADLAFSVLKLHPANVAKWPPGHLQSRMDCMVTPGTKELFRELTSTHLRKARR